MKKVGNYDFVFNDVDFGIDLASARKSAGVSSQSVAEKVGYKSGATILQIEGAKYTDGIGVRTILALCNLFHLSPVKYFEIEPRIEVKNERERV